MKQVFACLLVVCMMIGLAGCSSGVSQEAYDAVVAERNALKAQLDGVVEAPNELESPNAGQAVNPVKQVGGFDEQTVLSQISVEEYSYSSDYWDYAFLVLKNSSEFNIDLSVSIDFYDESGSLIGAKSDSQSAFEAGTETILYFMPDEKFSKMEYELSVDEEDWYDCVVSDLSYEVTEAKDKIILSVTNKGEEVAQFVQGSVLFFKEEVVTGFDRVYFTDDDNEIKPGKTIKKEIKCYEDFDGYKIYFSGRR